MRITCEVDYGYKISLSLVHGKKLRTIEEAEKVENRAVGRKYDVSKSYICDWCKKQNETYRVGHFAARKRGNRNLKKGYAITWTICQEATGERVLMASSGDRHGVATANHAWHPHAVLASTYMRLTVVTTYMQIDVFLEANLYFR